MNTPGREGGMNEDTLERERRRLQRFITGGAGRRGFSLGASPTREEEEEELPSGVGLGSSKSYKKEELRRQEIAKQPDRLRLAKKKFVEMEDHNKEAKHIQNGANKTERKKGGERERAKSFAPGRNNFVDIHFLEDLLDKASSSVIGQGTTIHDKSSVASPDQGPQPTVQTKAEKAKQKKERKPAWVQTLYQEWDLDDEPRTEETEQLWKVDLEQEERDSKVFLHDAQEGINKLEDISSMIDPSMDVDDFDEGQFSIKLREFLDNGTKTIRYVKRKSKQGVHIHPWPERSALVLG